MRKMQTRRPTIRVQAESRTGEFSKDSFMHVLDALFRYIEGIGNNLYPENPPQWNVARISMQSPLDMTVIAAEHHVTKARKTLHSAYRFLEKLDKPAKRKSRTSKPPTGVSEAEIKQALSLANTLSNGVISLKLSMDGSAPLALTTAVAHNAQVMLEALPKERHSFMTLRGRLEILNVHGGKHQFALFDALDGHRIDCHFEERHMDDVCKAIRGAIAVSGRVKFNRQNESVSIEVESIKHLPSRRELRWITAKGVNITNGIPSLQWVMEGRDD